MATPSIVDTAPARNNQLQLRLRESARSEQPPILNLQRSVAQINATTRPPAGTTPGGCAAS
jgi:hypothetical protein